MFRVFIAAFVFQFGILSASADLAGKAPIPVQTSPTEAISGPIIVDVKQSIVLETQEKIAGVSVGSPTIANIAVHNHNLILITGRSYGTTSLHILDALGNVIVDRQIQVASTATNEVLLSSGGKNYTMNCAPSCRPSPTIGDDEEYFSMIAEQAATLAGED